MSNFSLDIVVILDIAMALSTKLKIIDLVCLSISFFCSNSVDLEYFRCFGDSGGLDPADDLVEISRYLGSKFRQDVRQHRGQRLAARREPGGSAFCISGGIA